MDANEPLYVHCRNGVFVIPQALYRALGQLITNGFVYLREDPDVLTIATRPIAGGRRRLLNTRFRAVMFRDATQLAIVDLKESLRVMAVT
jgi:hypothetical protein